MKSNIPDDLKILIFSIGGGASEIFSQSSAQKKVNFKWHVNVMRSHVKWYFLFTDTQHWTEKQMKENGKTLRWLSINVNFMWIYYVFIYFCAFFVLSRLSFNRKIKIFSIFRFYRYRLRKVKHAIGFLSSKKKKNLVKFNRLMCIRRLRITLISHPFHPRMKID